MRRAVFLPADRPRTDTEVEILKQLYQWLADGELHDIAAWLAYHVGDRWDELTPLVRAKMQ
jgi:hypothetical protein